MGRHYGLQLTKTNLREHIMIEVRDAVAAAAEAARKFYEGKDLLDLQLEEVELSEDEKCWLITLGLILPNQNPDCDVRRLRPLTEISPLGASMQGQKYERKYKIFSVDADTGNVISMKIRQI